MSTKSLRRSNFSTSEKSFLVFQELSPELHVCVVQKKNALGSVDVIDSSAITLMYCLSYLKEIKGDDWNFVRSIAWFNTLWLQ